MKINFHFWYEDGREERVTNEVEYIPDEILYKELWWEKENSVIDFDTNRYTKVHYKQQ